MPKQKLARKPPVRAGKQGQAQKPGPHDPEHQQGEAIEQPATQYRQTDQSADVEAERPRTVRKESPL